MREPRRRALGGGSWIPQRRYSGPQHSANRGTNNFDLNLTKSILFGEVRRLEFRWEALNAFNRPQFVNVPQMSVNNTPAGQFLNRDFTDSGIRKVWVQVKLVF